MTKDDIIKMANDAGIKGPAPARAGFKMYASPQRLMAFAALVAAAEREACARVVEILMPEQTEDGLIGHTIAKAIREKGES